MSYSFSGKALPEDLRATLEAARDGVTFSPEAASESSAQASAAIEAAVALATSGKLGSAEVSCNISGHANPGHAPKSGWANDAVTISLSSQAVLEESAEPETPAQ